MKHLLTLITVLLFTHLTRAEPSAGLMQRILKAADKSSDGKLSLEEYKPLDVQAKHHGDEHFKAGDKNSDSFIDAAELADALKSKRGSPFSAKASSLALPDWMRTGTVSSLPRSIAKSPRWVITASSTSMARMPTMTVPSIAPSLPFTRSTKSKCWKAAP